MSPSNSDNPATKASGSASGDADLAQVSQVPFLSIQIQHLSLSLPLSLFLSELISFVCHFVTLICTDMMGMAISQFAINSRYGQMGWDSSSKHHAMNDPEGIVRGSHSSLDSFGLSIYELHVAIEPQRTLFSFPHSESHTYTHSIQFIPCLFPIDLTVL
jgi:hypothetical protein